MEKAKKHLINDADFTVISCGGERAIVDTVPAAYAGQWLAAAPGAKYLLLCGKEQYPQAVKYYLDKVPGGKVVLTPYMQYTLENILEQPLRSITVSKPRELALGEDKLKLYPEYAPMEPATLACELDGMRIGTGAAAGKPAVDAGRVTVAYLSASDYTEKLAVAIAAGIRDSGELSVELLDLGVTAAEDAVAAMKSSGAVLIGSPTQKGEAPAKLWEVLGKMRKADFAGKAAAAFGSYTAGNEAVEHTTQRLRQLEMKVPDSGLSIQYRVGENEKSAAYEYGYNFGCVVLGKANTRRSKLVKCLVCGEIFDSSLEICPVCGVGMDKCVPVDEEAVAYKCDTDRRYVILGGGIAALSAAEAIRKRDSSGSIVMISAENDPPINRPMLSKNMVAAALVEGKLNIKPQEWYGENGITLKLGTKAQSIDLQNKTVTLEGGETVSYDKLICALGAECFVPAIDGSDKSNVFCVRHLDDVKAIWKKLDSTRNVVVIGGGVLGLEAAAEMKKARKKVTVLEMAPRIMSRQIDEECAERLVKAADKYGIKIMTGVQIAAIVGEDAASGVLLADGTVIPAGVVILSCGNRANSDIAAAAGIGCGRAVKVDRRMATDAADVFACGDCAELDGVNLQLWQEATEQGKVAGANAAGDSLRYDPAPMGVSFEGMNTRLYAIGDVGSGGLEYKTVEYSDELSGSWRKYWFADGRLKGAELFGDTEKAAEVIGYMDKGARYSEIHDAL